MGKIEFLGIYFQRFLHLPFKSLALVDIKTALGHVLTQTLTRTLDRPSHEKMANAVY